MYFCTRMIFKCQIHVPPPNECEARVLRKGRPHVDSNSFSHSTTCYCNQLVSDTRECLVQPRKGCNQCFPRLRWLYISTSSILHLLDTGQYSPSSWASLPDFIRPTEEAETPNSPGVNSSYMWGMAFSWKLAMSATLNQLNWFVFLIFICQQTNIKDIAIC